MTALTLTGSSAVDWVEAPVGDENSKVYFGRDDVGAGAIQVGVTETPRKPTKAVLEELWKSRGTKAPMGFVVAAVSPDGTWIHYPESGGTVLGPLTRGQAERQLQSVLDEENGLAAHARIRGFQDAAASGGTKGFSNQFLFASYYLEHDLPTWPEWAEARERAIPMLGKRGNDLVAALGFDSERSASERVLVLRASSGPRRAVAVLLRDDEQFDQKAPTYQLTPVAKGTAAR